ncbi:MAG: rhamnulokinase [Acidobacteriaceae bacterium]
MSGDPALVGIDLGAESCRVSLLQWRAGEPKIRMVHRFANRPLQQGESLYWDLERILHELERGLRECAELAPEGIASIGVTGWAVDYVRLDGRGRPLAQPFCYRDPRTGLAMKEAHERISAEQMYALTGVQVQPLNTVYQLYADKRSGMPVGMPWVNLPEYVLCWLGAPRVAEVTNASHTALMGSAGGNWAIGSEGRPSTAQWVGEIFAALGLDVAEAPELVETGTVLGGMRHPLRGFAAFEQTRLVATACHDTAAAIAGIDAEDENWAYISSGTWSLVGTRVAEPHNTKDACGKGFTNLRAATGDILFHRGMVGMWLLRQCMDVWEEKGPYPLEELMCGARRLPAPECVLDLDDPELLLPGRMPERINAQLEARGAVPLAAGREAAPVYANLIFHSLAKRYATLLEDLRGMAGKKLNRICVVGGGSRNEFLNELTAAACGVPVERCSAESSTLGNFAVQWARLEQADGALDPELLSRLAGRLRRQNGEGDL